MLLFFGKMWPSPFEPKAATEVPTHPGFRVISKDHHARCDEENRNQTSHVISNCQCTLKTEQKSFQILTHECFR